MTDTWLLAASNPSVGQTLAGLLGFGMLTMLAASVVLWGRVLRWGPRSVGVDLEARPATVPWGLVDLLLYVVIFGVTVATAQAFVLRLHDVKLPVELQGLSQPALVDFIWANSIGTVAGTIVGAGLVLLRHGRLARRLGCGLESWREDLRLGTTGFLLLVPPILLIQLALTQFFPSQHPLIEAVRRNPEPRFLWASGFAAVAVAPLVEELQFRVLLQGWFQNLAVRVLSARTLLLGGDPESSAPLLNSAGTINDTGETFESPAVDSKTVDSTTVAQTSATAEFSTIVYAAPAYDSPTAAPRRASWWPVLASAALFAGAHMSHGPDPIPLFLLSAGLGVLYRQTGRIWPSVIVHFLLNLWTLLAMTVSLYVT